MHRIWIGETSPPPPLAGVLAAFLARRGEDFALVPDPADADWVHVEAGTDAPEVRPGAVVFGAVPPHDAVATLAAVDDLDALPITTWWGFGWRGPAFRMLAGRGDDRVRSVDHALREVVYLVETYGSGHLMFDDEDLGRWRGWADAFAEGLAHLPWELTWEATIGGRRVHRR